MRFEYRIQERDDVREMFAVHAPEERQALIGHVEAKGRGKPIGEQMLADTHAAHEHLATASRPPLAACPHRH